MDELVQEYDEVSENFDSKLEELRALKGSHGDFDVLFGDNKWVGKGAIPKKLQITGLATGFQLHMKLSNGVKGPGKVADLSSATKRLRFGFSTNALTPSKAQKLTSRIKGLKVFTAVASVAVVGFQIAGLVESVERFDKMAREFKRGRSSVIGEVSKYIKDLEDAQDSFNA